MEITDIRTGLEGFTEPLTSQTYIGTYKVQTRSSLLADGLGTRANSIWKMAQYIVATYDNKPTENIANYLIGWNALVKIYKNQFLLLEIDANHNWQMYDSDCNLLGGNEFIKNYLEEQARIAKSRVKTIGVPTTLPPFPRQQIFYGAPGTGKSHIINCEVVEKKRPHIRTTFHPDSDYSTFVGAYKPTSTSVRVTTLVGTKQVLVENAEPEKKIIYEFVPQAFLKAYTEAWKNQNEPFFLIIEEINRGNCAQIFGDLFQLLDRDDNGWSKYHISPDNDIQKFLQTDTIYGFAELDEELKDSIPDEIRFGVKMKLPQNLYIWATMNTSDQSLFPIDSAFKRRWDWKYIRISEGNGKDGKPLNYRIQFKTTDGNIVDVSWWEFVKSINKDIEDATKSEDKKLGYFFCKPDKKAKDEDKTNTIISAETFVGKVVFYLWQDVF